MTTDWHLENLLGSPDDQPSIESSKVKIYYATYISSWNEKYYVIH